MAKEKGVIYFKMVVSYGEPTEFDDVGCDGMYIESVEKTDEVTQLKDENERLREYIEETCEEDFVMWCREQDALKEVIDD